jgi:hypothetical protein
MQEYEIRILRSKKHPSINFPTGQTRGDIAVQLARRLSGNSGFEVWRESDCICRGAPSAQPNFWAASAHHAWRILR